MRVILDASVAVKAFLADEHGHEQAIALLDAEAASGDTLMAPDILLAEVGHALLGAARRGRIAHESVAAAVLALVDLDLTIVSSADLVALAVGVAIPTGLSVYDAVYLVAAEARGAPLITADRRQYEAGLATGRNVAWLADLPLV
jgi:predicted nucleic acid-binding protein